MGVTVSRAGSGTIQTFITLPGEIILNDDTQALVTPYVPGHVKEIRKRQGEPVKAGEVMAVLQSRQLADTASAYLANRERVVLAEKNFEREKSLWKKKISPETDYLEAKMSLSEARISLRTTRQKLMAMGLRKTAIDGLSGRNDGALTRYEIVSPNQWPGA
jgi:cobalt-zinc-cadmium efflux system membrane fusion protein